MQFYEKFNLEHVTDGDISQKGFPDKLIFQAFGSIWVID